MRPNPSKRSPVVIALAVLITVSAPLSPARAQTPEPASAQSPTPESPAQEPAIAERQSIPITLEQTIRAALSGNFDILRAGIDVDLAERNAGIERSLFDPTFEASASYAKRRDPTVSVLDLGNSILTAGAAQTNRAEIDEYRLGLTGLLTPGTTYTLSARKASFDQPDSENQVFGLNPQDFVELNAEIRQPLLRNAGVTVTTGRLQIAFGQRTVAELREDAELNNRLFEVTSAYWRFAFADQEYRDRVRSHENAEERLALIENDEETGKRSQVDVDFATAQKLEREVEMNDALRIREDALDALLLLIDRSIGSEERNTLGARERIQLVATDDGIDDVTADRESSITLALETRADYQQVLAQIRNQELEIRLEDNSRLPQLDAVATWSQRGLDQGFNDSFEELGTGRFYSWTVGVEFSVPLGNRAARNRARAARDRLRRLQIDRDQLEAQIVADVDRVQRRLTELGIRVRLFKDREALRRSLWDAEEQKRTQGLDYDPYRASQLEDDLVESETDYRRALLDYETAKAEHYAVLGTLQAALLGPAEWGE